NCKVLEDRRRDNNDAHEFRGEQTIYIADKGEVNNPRTGKPAHARFLGEARGAGFLPVVSPGPLTPSLSPGGGGEGARRAGEGNVLQGKARSIRAGSSPSG